MKSKNKISLIAPFYNEEKGVVHFIERVNEVMEKISDRFDLEIVCINDGSRDGTLNELVHVKKNNSHMKIIDFSRNFGKEAAITAGLDFATGDIIVPIDSDLQHPPEVVLDMIDKWEEGYEVVLARRIDRNTDKAIQRMTARAFYEVSRYISHIDIPADVGDFRLMDKKVVKAIKQLNENCRFMKGIFAWVGFKTTTIDYKVANRAFGQTNFNTWKLWNFALEGITSFSTFPLRVWTYIGVGISLFSFLFAMYLIFKALIFGVDTPGYTSTMVTILFCSGVQLIGVGVLGEYIGRIFSEVKRRPSYIVREVIE